MKEQEFMDCTGLIKQDIKLPSTDNLGIEHFTIPDAVMMGRKATQEDEEESQVELILLEYKNGVMLNTNGARGGREAAENQKGREIVKRLPPAMRDSFDPKVDADRRRAWGFLTGRQQQYIASRYGWNHSIYKMITMLHHNRERAISETPEGRSQSK